MRMRAWPRIKARPAGRPEGGGRAARLRSALLLILLPAGASVTVRAGPFEHVEPRSFQQERLYHEQQRYREEEQQLSPEERAQLRAGVGEPPRPPS